MLSRRLSRLQPSFPTRLYWVQVLPSGVRMLPSAGWVLLSGTTTFRSFCACFWHFLRASIAEDFTPSLSKINCTRYFTFYTFYKNKSVAMQRIPYYDNTSTILTTVETLHFTTNPNLNLTLTLNRVSLHESRTL